MRRALLTALVAGACFARKPGDDRLPRADGGAITLRLVSPALGATVTRRRPVVRWTSSVRSPGWAVEFCADPRCERVLQRVTASGFTAFPPADLPTATVFWRVLDPTRVGVTAHPRYFVVPRGAPTGAPPSHASVASPLRFDADGDGRAEYLDPNGSLRPGDTLARGAEPLARISRDLTAVVSAVADLDADGSPDLAGVVVDPVAPSSGFDLVLWRGPLRSGATAPSCTLRLRQFRPAEDQRNDFDALGGDFDGDGFGDVVVGERAFQRRRGRFYVVRGGPACPEPEHISVIDSPRGIGTPLHALAAADLDGDGRDDLLAAATENPAYAGLVAIYAGGPGGLDPLPAWSLARDASANDGLGRAGGVADIDGDGALDLGLTAPYARGGCVYSYPWDVARRTFPVDSSSGACSTGSALQQPFGVAAALGDFDGDASADAVVVERPASDRLWLARGTRQGFREDGVTSLPGVTFGGLSVVRLAAAQLDDDGIDDLVLELGVNDRTTNVVRLRGTPSGPQPWPDR